MLTAFQFQQNQQKLSNQMNQNMQMLGNWNQNPVMLQQQMIHQMQYRQPHGYNRGGFNQPPPPRMTTGAGEFRKKPNQ